jgi:hypothetical protein
MRGICATYVHLTSLLLLVVTPRVVLGTETAEPKVAAAARGALSDDNLANLIAFTRAFGLLRFFHPSDQAAAADWDRLTVKGVENLETTRSSRALADGLQALFAPVAPSARFLVGEPLGRLMPPKNAARIVRWRHHGFGFGQRAALSHIYFNDREQRPISPQPADWLAPTDPVLFELGRGVTLALPVVVWADADGKTLPTIDAPSRPAGGMPTPNRRAPSGRRTRIPV